MAKTVQELAQEATRALLVEAYGEPTQDEGNKLSDHAKRFKETENVLRELLRTDGKPKSCPPVKLSEAVFSADFKLLFPRVVMEVLQRPQEPIYLGQTLLSKTVNVDTAQLITFPTFGAIRAFEVADSQEYPEQDPSFAKHSTEIRTRRYGLKLVFSKELIEQSAWDVLALYIEAAGAAMKRLKEEKIFSEYENRAVCIFDNESADTADHTTGVGADGLTPNGTFSHDDLLDMMAALGTNQYIPTDLILHPMAWSIWAKDPILRYQLLHRGGVGQGNLGGFGQDAAAQSAYMPFGLQVNVSPFQKMEFGKTLAAGLDTPGAGNYTTITLVDRNSSILVLQRKPMSISEWDDPMRDLMLMRFAEQYGLALLNGGRSAVTAKNVRIDNNHKPVFTTAQVALP